MFTIPRLASDVFPRIVGGGCDGCSRCHHCVDLHLRFASPAAFADWRPALAHRVHCNYHDFNFRCTKLAVHAADDYRWFSGDELKNNPYPIASKTL